MVDAEERCRRRGQGRKGSPKWLLRTAAGRRESKLISIGSATASDLPHRSTTLMSQKEPSFFERERDRLCAEITAVRLDFFVTETPIQ